MTGYGSDRDHPEPRKGYKMSNNSAIAAAIANVVMPSLDELKEKVALLAKSETPKHTQADVNKAAEKPDTDEQIAAAKSLAAAKAKHEASQKVLHEAYKAAKVAFFADTEDDISDADRTALIAECQALRATVLGAFKVAQTTDPEWVMPEIPGVKGTRKVNIGQGAGTPKARVAAITLDGKPVEPRPTFTNLIRGIKATTAVTVPLESIMVRYLAAANAEAWDKVEKGSVHTFSLVVDPETNRSVEIAVTA